MQLLLNIPQLGCASLPACSSKFTYPSVFIDLPRHVCCCLAFITLTLLCLFMFQGPQPPVFRLITHHTVEERLMQVGSCAFMHASCHQPGLLLHMKGSTFLLDWKVGWDDRSGSPMYKTSGCPTLLHPLAQSHSSHHCCHTLHVQVVGKHFVCRIFLTPFFCKKLHFALIILG